MPLSEIIKEGETWKRVEGKFELIGGLEWETEEKKLTLYDLKGKPFGYLDETFKITPPSKTDKITPPSKTEPLIVQHTVFNSRNGLVSRSRRVS